MNLFYFKVKKYEPFIFIIVKIDNKSDMEKLKVWTNEIFQILIDHKKAKLNNILIFSIINDYEEKTTNLILPSTGSNNALVHKCENNTELLNKAIVEILLTTDSEFYLEVGDNKVKMHIINISLAPLAEFYKI